MPATPQDHKTKAKPEKPFTFEHDGETYTLPPAFSVISKIPGRVVRDASMDGQEGQLRLGFTLLEAVDVEPGTVDAIYAKPAPEMMEVILSWLSHKASKGDASVGESLGSSN